MLQVSLSNTTDGSYTVTQLNPVSHPAGGDENNLQFSINYVVTDGNGDTATGSFSIDVDDDMPTATGRREQRCRRRHCHRQRADRRHRRRVRGGRCGADRRGDGVAAGSNTSLPVSGGVGAPVNGSFGVLTLNANGSYSYDGNPNAVLPAGATDTFVYTITDGDGDTSTVTLTIALTNSSLAVSNDDLTVNEAALSTGSNPSSTAETVSGTVVDNVTPGVAPY